jgi:hypothetical protein
MSKHKFDPDMFKNIQQMMNTITNVQQTQPNSLFDFGGIKKYVIALAGLLLMAGFGIGILVGLMF